MGRIHGSKGTTVAIGAASDDVTTLAKFQADTTYKLLDGITNIGEYGDNAQLITSDHVNSGRTKKAIGTRNSGSMAVACDRQPNDVGQLAAIAAADTDDRYNIRVVTPIGRGKFETDYFPAYVLGRRKGYGGANDKQTLALTFELDEAPTFVPAPA